VIRAGAALGLAVLLAACSREPRPERVLLITVDTLRADHVGAYGDELARTPALDALAAAGARFDAAISPTPITLPAHTTLMTGLEPPHHGVRGNGVFALPAEIPTLAAQLQGEGFATAAFVGAIVLDRRYGLARGFDHYDDAMSLRHSAKGGGYAERRAEAVVDSAIAWLEAAPSRWFVWVHVYDPHAEYDPPPAWKDRIPRDAYRSEIAYADAQLRRLFELVSARWRDGKTLIVATADHGESLGEHGEPTHSFTLYDATQRVPLLVAGPGIEAGTVVANVVRLADLAPTLLALAGAKPLPETDGMDVSGALRGSDGAERLAYLETIDTRLNQGWSPLYGVRGPRWKYIRAPRPELYDLIADPGERRDLSSSEPRIAQELDREVSRAHAGARALAWASAAPSAAERAQLESLGYVGAAPAREPDLTVGGTDPKDVVARMRDFDVMRALIDAKDYAGALARAEAFPGDGAYVCAMRALAALHAGEYARAEKHARACAAVSPGYSDCWVSLGRALAAQQKNGEAEAALRRGSEVDPTDAAPLLALGDLYVVAGDDARAMRAYEAAIEAREGSLEAHWRLAALRFSAGDAAAARALLERLPRDELTRPEVALTLAAGEIEGGFRAEARARLEAALARDPESSALRDLLAKAMER
jgi:arylsulfatase A-like enzyme/cytochrome c-type biogenesis protein CcmH/NrfG